MAWIVANTLVHHAFCGKKYDAKERHQGLAPFKAPRVVSLNQVHSSTIIDIDLLDQKALEASLVGNNAFFMGDALITSRQDLTLGIYTADCAALLLQLDIYSENSSFKANIKTTHAPRHTIIAALHAGYKGLFLGIIEQTISYMRSKALSHASATNKIISSNIIGVLGPCATALSYEVQEDFVAKTPERFRRFIYGHSSRFFFDLHGAVKYEASSYGVSVAAVGIETITAQDFYSHRCGDVERNWAYIWNEGRSEPENGYPEDVSFYPG